MRFRRTAYSLVIFVAVLLLFVTPIHAATSQILQGHAAEAIRASRVIDRVPAATEMKLAIGLPLRNPDELEKFLKQLVDPASPGYRHYLTPEQFAERYAPSEEEYQALADYFRANGFAVTGTHSNRTILDVSGTASEIERVLHVNMMHWNHPVRGEFFAPDRDPSIDAGVTVLDISGLDNFVLPRPMNLKPHPLTDVQPLTTGSGPAGLFIGNDYRAAYAPGVTLNGAGQAVGLLELDGFYASDVQSNFSKAGLTPVPVQTVLLNGYNGAPGNANVEVILDIMMAAYMAPGLSKVIVYEGYNPDDVLNRMATDNQARQLSSSWGWSPMDAIVDQIFKQMIAQGQSLFQASGDDGAYRGAVMPPADDPNITVVGGTSLTTAGAGGAWLSETAWSGSGGGVSTTWPIPSYQQSVNMAAIGGSSTKRNLPDVSLLADIQIFLICNNGQQIMVGGTSAAAPLWAGFIALANQQAVANHQPAVGFLNPAIYALGAGPNYQSDLHDIIAGSNGFSAMPGYDLATGWGSPTGQPLINALTATTATPGFSLLSSATALSLAPGANGTATITINPQQGFTGNVSLAISGLPAGVTGAFSPATAVTTSTVTITAASSAVASSSTVTITGTSGSLTGTARLTLTITGTPSFTVSAMPATLNVTRGSIGTSSITVMPQGDFRGSVTLSASGLPTGVSASFSPGTGSSLLSLTAGSAATLGNATITITGTSGSLRSSTTIALTVTAPAPGFTIAASPASISLKPGASAPTTISVSLQTGFSGTVAFSLDGLPTGVTGTFNPPTTNRSTTLTLVAAANAVPGTSTITVKGTSGTIIARATIALTISAPPSFTLTAAPASLTVLAGASGTSTITVTPQGGFASAVALTASGLPAGVTATFTPASTTRTSVVTFTASSAAVAASATVNITGTSGALSSRVAIALTITKPPSFTLAVSPAALTIAQGTTGASTLTLTPLNGFSSPVLISISGVPSGVVPSFIPGNGPTATLTFAASPVAAPVTSTLTVTGKAGTLSQSVSIAITVQASGTTSGSTVNLAGTYNVMGMVTDNAQFLSSSGLDGGGRAYSGNLLSTVRTAGGAPYNFGPSNAPSAVTGGTIALPSGKYSSLTILATGVNGNQVGQSFVVTYSDGTTSSFTQSLSDWCAPQNYTGESNAISMSYRNNSNGTFDVRRVMLYGYTFSLSSARTLKSITLPANRNVVVLAMSLGPAAPSTTMHAIQKPATFWMLPKAKQE